MVLWDANHIELIEKGELKKGDFIEVSNGSVRNGEVHLSAFSDIKKSKEKIENVKTDRAFSVMKINDAVSGKSAKIRAIIVKVFEPRYFEDKKNPGEKRALLNLVLDDGAGTIRCVLFGDTISNLGLTNEEIFDAEKFNSRKEELLGAEKMFTGNFKMNSYFNTLEFNVSGVEDMNVDELIKELGVKSRG